MDWRSAEGLFISADIHRLLKDRTEKTGQRLKAAASGSRQTEIEANGTKPGLASYAAVDAAVRGAISDAPRLDAALVGRPNTAPHRRP